jgi:multidrug efflux pump
VENYVAYVGTGSPRFYLPLDQQLPAANFAQFVVLTDDIESREAVRQWLIEDRGAAFPELQVRVTRLENGPPVGYPVQFRVSGEHIDRVQAIARQVADKVRANPHVTNVNLDWNEPSKVVRLRIDQDRARALGVSSAQVAQFLSGSLSGTSVSTYREGNELIEILLRGPGEERERGSACWQRWRCRRRAARRCRCRRSRRLEDGFEDGIIWHRNRLPTVTVRADIYGKELPAT